MSRYFLLHFTILMGVFHCSLSSFAQIQAHLGIEELNVFKANLEGANDFINTLESGFVQTKHLDFVEGDIISTGTIIYEKDNGVRWEYVDPQKYIIVIKQNKVYFKERESFNELDVESSKEFKALNELLIQLLEGNVLDTNTFDFKVAEFQDDYLVELFPKNESLKAYISGIDLRVDKIDFGIISFTMKEYEGDFMEITFIDKAINEVIDDAVFDVNN